MKYVNQINIALVGVAAVAVALAFGQTYLSSEPPPRYVQTPSAPQPLPVESRDAGEEATNPAPAATDPVPVGSPRAAETGSPRVSPASNPAPAGPRPTLGRRPASPTSVPARQVDTRRPPPAPAPISREAQRRGPGSRPVPQQEDEDEDSRQAPPQNFPRPPEARRQQDRRVNPAPPPARSSMPEQRPQR